MASNDLEKCEDGLRRVMFGNGILMIFAALLGGLGLWITLLGGVEIYPGHIIDLHLPGSVEGWQKAHSGPILNGLMVIAVAWGLPLAGLTGKTSRLAGWIVILDGWSNTAFYILSNFSPNRGLAFGDSRLGPADIFSCLALAPAYVFGVLTMVALAVIGWQAIRKR